MYLYRALSHRATTLGAALYKFLFLSEQIPPPYQGAATIGTAVAQRTVVHGGAE